MSRNSKRKRAVALNTKVNTSNTSNTKVNTSNTKINTSNTGNTMSFSFGDPETVLRDQLNDYVGTQLISNGQYYQPPVSLMGLARLLRANAFHGPLIEFIVNVVMRGFKPSQLVSRRTMYALTTDYMVFKNAYMQRVRNPISGDVVATRHLPAINMRRLKEAGRYGLLTSTGNLIKFNLGEVVHIKNYDVIQNIYGVPWYLGAIQSMLLNEDATLFRRKYYLNGAHMGYIFYSSSAGLSEDDQEAIKNAIKSSRGVGNFRNMFLHLPGGREKDIQILPVGDFSTKDELEKIKNISRDDIIAAHRIPAAMASVLPSGNSNFGDITKVDAVYEKNEVLPIRQQLEMINDWLPDDMQISFDTVA